MKDKKSDRIFGYLLALAGIAGLCVILFSTFSAMKPLSEAYRRFQNADLSQPFKDSLSFDDQYYVMLGSGIEILPQETGKAERLASFVAGTLGDIDQRFLSSGVLYSMMVSSTFAYSLYLKFKDDRKKHLLGILLAVLLSFAVYLGAVRIMHAVYGIPFYLPKASRILSAVTGLFSVAGGMCAVALLLRLIPFKKITAVLVIPVIFAAFLFGTVFESGLYSPRYTDSFDYVAQIDERLLDEEFDDAYYDEEKNVLIVEGKEYEPEQTDNPDHLTGASRIGAILFEIVNPYSGSVLLLIEEILNDLSAGIKAAYLLKAGLWSSLLLLVKREKA